jgi:hypothetical protein
MGANARWQVQLWATWQCLARSDRANQYDFSRAKWQALANKKARIELLFGYYVCTTHGTLA